MGAEREKKSMPRGAVSESSKLRKGRANAQGSASPRLRTCPASSRPAGALRDSGNGTANRGQTRSPTPGGLTCERDQRGPKPSTNRGLTGIPGGPRKVWQVAKDGTHLMFGCELTRPASLRGWPLAGVGELGLRKAPAT